MPITPARQNPNPGQVAVQLVGAMVRDNKAPGIAHSASVMHNGPNAFSVGAPPSTPSSGKGGNLDVMA
jgi:hypothetical protein